MKTAVLGIPILILSVFACSPEEAPIRDYWPTVEWRTSLPDKQGIASKKLEEVDAFIEQKLPQTSSILLVRNGYIVLERYYDAEPNRGRWMWSATKGVLSSLVGIAIDKGYIKSESQRMMDFFPDYIKGKINPKAYEITLRHLLTMSDGISREEMAYNFSDKNLAVEFRANPGSESFYNSMSPQIVSIIITKSTGSTALDFARKHLFEPIGIRQVSWDEFDGHTRGAYGMALTTRDMAKIGFLFLNNGFWDGVSIIPKNWVKKCSTRQIINRQFNEFYRDYGYYWWLHPIKKHYAYYAEGYGGQFIVVIPDLDLVAVITSDERTLDDEKYLSILSDIVVPSIR